MNGILHRRTKFFSTKFFSFTHSRDMEGSQNYKSRSSDPFSIPFGIILQFFSLVHLVVNVRTKFEVSSFNRSRDMEGVLEF